MKFRFFRAKILALLVKLLGLLLKIELPPVPSASGIIVKNNKLLVVKLSYRDGYSLPGGISKKGEFLEETLKREIKEETGLTVVRSKYFASFPSGIELPTVNATFIVEVKGEIKNSEEGQVSWEDPKDILNKIIYKDCVLAVKKYFHLK